MKQILLIALLLSSSFAQATASQDAGGGNTVDSKPLETYQLAKLPPNLQTIIENLQAKATEQQDVQTKTFLDSLSARRIFYVPKIESVSHSKFYATNSAVTQMQSTFFITDGALYINSAIYPNLTSQAVAQALLLEMPTQDSFQVKVERIRRLTQ